MNFAFALVGLLYFGVVALGRRAAPVLTWRWAIFFYALTVGFLFLPLFGPYVHLPLDYLYTLPPWSGMQTFRRLQNPEMNDLILQIAPWAKQVRASWMALEAPLWNPLAGGGYPLLANGQSSALSILRVLTLPLSLAHSFAAESALKLLIALSFAFIYARRRLSPAASGIVAVSFAFSTFLIVWLVFPIVAVAAFLPAVLLSVDLLCEEVTWLRVLFAASLFTLLLTGGHPETAAHIVFFASLYLLFHLWNERSKSVRGAGGIVLAGLLSILLAAPFLLPFVEALPKTLRYETLKSDPQLPGAEGAWFLPPIFNAAFYGTIPGDNVWGPAHAEVICGYGGILGLAGWAALVIILTRRRRWKSVEGFHVVAAVIVLGIIMRWPLIYDAFHALPLFSLAANGRMRLLFCWTMAYLAGALFDAARGEEKVPVTIGLCAAGASLLAMFLLNDFPGDKAFEQAFVTTVPRIAVLVVALVLFSSASLKRKNWAGAFLMVVVAADLWTFGYSWNPSLPEKYFYPETPLIRFLEARQGENKPGKVQPFRVTGTNAALFPNSGAMFGLADIRAHDPMAFGRYLGALRYFTGYSTYDYFAMLKNLDDPFLDYLNVRYLVTSKQESYHSDRFQEVYAGKDGRVYENRDVLPRFYPARNVLVEFDPAARMRRITQNREWADTVVLERIPTVLMSRVRSDLLAPRPLNAPMARVKIVSWSARRFLLDIDAPRWTLVVGSQPDWPGWHLTRNGSEDIKDIEVNAAFIGFIIPPGHSTVEVAYQPRAYYAGVLLSALAACGLAAWPLRKRLRGTGADRISRDGR